ncbi:hypothetical protein VTK73DRAFT_636 [Phialemonium thermophilum]|uniref:DUF427 domain-containing protein n=1 Tax=Phialemonium thermophilum TaxID=223376 RepID=A0ABR3XDE6_9PEZI
MAPQQLSLPELAAKIATEGPVKHEPTKRRIRGRVGGRWLFDTTEAEYVWEHPNYPLFYVPLRALQAGDGKVSQDKPDPRGFWVGTLDAGEAKQIEVAGFDKGPLSGLVKIPPKSIDAWYAEDEQVLGPHPRDPYKRIECLPSTREVRIEVDGVEIARGTDNVFLYETGLRPRYYLLSTAVRDWSLLRDSDTTTFCPYKGQASYYHLQVGKRVIQDAVWYYQYPVPESAAVQSRLCFYNEKVDVFIDGKKEDN